MDELVYEEGSDSIPSKPITEHAPISNWQHLFGRVYNFNGYWEIYYDATQVAMENINMLNAATSATDYFTPHVAI